MLLCWQRLAWMDASRFELGATKKLLQPAPLHPCHGFPRTHGKDVLSPDQEFFVISFDAQAHPMFGKLPPTGKFLHPTKDNIYRLNQWVGSIVHGSNTLPASSLGIAMELKPDAIFLLSDGEIRDNTVGDLRIYNHETNENGESTTLIPIHTVLLHSNVGFLTLKLIADENAGVFTRVTTISNPE